MFWNNYNKKKTNCTKIVTTTVIPIKINATQFCSLKLSAHYDVCLNICDFCQFCLIKHSLSNMIWLRIWWCFFSKCRFFSFGSLLSNNVQCLGDRFRWKTWVIALPKLVQKNANNSRHNESKMIYFHWN